MQAKIKEYHTDVVYSAWGCENAPRGRMLRL